MKLKSEIPWIVTQYKAGYFFISEYRYSIAVLLIHRKLACVLAYAGQNAVVRRNYSSTIASTGH